MHLTLEEFINEKLITFNKISYPKYNNVVILAGGAGSGKGFIKGKLLGIEGKTLDVDEFKKFIIKSKVLNRKLHGRPSTLDLGNSDDVYTLHTISKYLNIEGKVKQTLKSGVESSLNLGEINKPNLLFDITMKDINSLREVSDYVQSMGYDTKNIHIVWVLTDIDIAMERNASRSRKVPEEILKVTHRGVAATFKEIIKGTFNIRDLSDGDIFIVFNDEAVIDKSEFGGSYIKDIDYIKVKYTNKPIGKISKPNLDRISSSTKTSFN